MGARFVIVPDNNSFDFLTGLRGYHVYRNIWKLYVRQNISFRQERANEYGRFAVCCLVKIPGKIELTVVGHIPREISRYVWYAMEEGANIAYAFSYRKM